MEENRRMNEHYKTNPDNKYRTAIAQQAQELLQAHKRASLEGTKNKSSSDITDVTTVATTPSSKMSLKVSSPPSSGRGRKGNTVAKKSTMAESSPAWQSTWKSIPTDVRAMGRAEEVRARI